MTKDNKVVGKQSKIRKPMFESTKHITEALAKRKRKHKTDSDTVSKEDHEASNIVNNFVDADGKSIPVGVVREIHDAVGVSKTKVHAKLAELGYVRKVKVKKSDEAIPLGSDLTNEDIDFED